MAHKSIECGPVTRTLTLLAVKIRMHRHVQRLWKAPGGLASISRFCIKVNPFENLAEASALQFVAEHTDIPVPKVYWAFLHKGRTYIVMSRIDGRPAWYKWAERSPLSKERIILQLQRMIRELRSIAPPFGTRVVNVDDGPIRDCRLPSSMPSGPYQTTRHFHEALANEFDFDVRYEGLSSEVEALFSFYREMPETTVFTHGDLSSLNILVKGDVVVGIVDWETAGWFPPYWEYTSAWNVNPMNPFWQEEVDKFIPVMSQELKMDQIRRRYFGDF